MAACLQQAIDLSLRYLDSDDYGAHYKKCLRALTAIGTPEATAVVRDCAHSDMEALSHEARYRPTKIAE